MSVEYEVIAVRYGTLVARRSALYLDWDAYGEPDGDERLDYFFYVLRHSGETIILDTGFHPEAGSDAAARAVALELSAARSSTSASQAPRRRRDR